MKWLNVLFILIMSSVLFYKLYSGETISNSYLAVAILLIVTSFIGLFRKRESGE
ncbi:MAG TPA: LPXTG cell wall anchor domain-containing protein [Anoxybacillus sp.]|nr:LPXTG cell wall anchor domain-containing protein [Anoxybacillus sp.]